MFFLSVYITLVNEEGRGRGTPCMEVVCLLWLPLCSGIISVGILFGFRNTFGGGGGGGGGIGVGWHHFKPDMNNHIYGVFSYCYCIRVMTSASSANFMNYWTTFFQNSHKIKSLLSSALYQMKQPTDRCLTSYSGVHGVIRHKSLHLHNIDLGVISNGSLCQISTCILGSRNQIVGFWKVGNMFNTKGFKEFLTT